MIAVVATKDGKVDFVIQTSIHYGLIRAGKPVVRFSDQTNFRTAKKVCVVGHGSPGKIEHFAADTIAKILADPVTGVPTDIETLIFTSCYAGALVEGQPKTAVIDVVARALKARGITGLVIKGAMGPSVKASVLGETFRVVTPKGTPGYNRTVKAQGELTKSFDYEFLGDMTLTNPTPSELETAGEFAGEVTFQFFKDFVTRLESERNLMAPEDAMRTLEI
jgi:hypothetical protein